MYRNYDGVGGAFGDVGVTATSGDQATVAVYAAQRSADGALTIMAINKTAQPQTTALTVAGFAATGPARVYRYAPTNLAAIERLSDVTVFSGTSVTWAPQSITVLVLPGAAGPQPTPTSTFTATPVPPSSTRTATSTSPPLFQLAGSIRTAGGQPVAGVAAALPPTGQSATTDASGTYAFAAAPGVPLQVAPRRSAAPAPRSPRSTRRGCCRPSPGAHVDGDPTPAADVTGDGTLSTLDAAYILQHAVGNATRSPPAQTCASDWLFVPNATSAPNQTSIAPALTTGSCQPGAIAFAPLAANASGQSFTAILLGDCTGSWTP
jgi:hypothetical protein